MKFKRVSLTLLIFAHFQNSSSVNECYVCSDPRCRKLITEKCPENRNMTCMASLPYEGTEIRGCSNEFECPEEVATSADCYVCERDLCNKNSPIVNSCYTCINEGCNELTGITVQKCKRSSTSDRFYCFSTVLMIPLDVFGTLHSYSAGCIGEKRLHLLQACRENSEHLCYLCNYDLCNDGFLSSVNSTTIYSTFTTEQIENISFGRTPENIASAGNNKVASIMLAGLSVIKILSCFYVRKPGLGRVPRRAKSDLHGHPYESGSKRVQRGCSKEERCAEETAKTTDCYVCDRNLFRYTELKP